MENINHMKVEIKFLKEDVDQDAIFGIAAAASSEEQLQKPTKKPIRYWLFRGSQHPQISIQGIK